MKRLFVYFTFIIPALVVFYSCQKAEGEISPSVPFRIEGLHDNIVYHNGDSLYGRIVVLEDSLVSGMDVKKIDCRLGNIVIGTVENALICPFGIKLIDKPIGVHTFSVIIKCKAPDCEETFWRYNMKVVTIAE